MHPDFQTAEPSVTDIATIVATCNKPLDLQHELIRITTHMEYETLVIEGISWRYFEIPVGNIDRLYFIKADKDAAGFYYELAIRINFEDEEDPIFVSMYAECDSNPYGAINGFIFVSKNINFFMMTLLQDRPKRIFTCEIHTPIEDHNTFVTIMVHSSSHDFSHCYSNDKSRCHRMATRVLPILKNKGAILELLAKDGIKIHKTFVETIPSLRSLCCKYVNLYYPKEKVPFFLHNALEFQEKIEEFKDVFAKGVGSKWESFNINLYKIDNIVIDECLI